jgi:hypothetical protein
MSYKKKSYLTKKEFTKRFIITCAIAAGVFLFSILIGILGYHYIVKLDWIDAFLNASMILGGMGQVSDLKNNSEKIFAAFYALFSGVTFLSSVSIFMAPLIHRFLNKYLVPDEDD